MSLIFDSEGFPDFFAQAPILHIQDKLAWFLGAADSGLLQYRYADAVKLAGHSCPTVAAAYLMTLAGIKALYGEELAQRGEIEVFFAQSPDSGITGVMASIVQLLTGAASDTGFAGIGAQALFKRRNLLQFNANIEAVMLMRRQDNGDAVSIALNTEIVPWPEEMRALMPKVMSGLADAQEQSRFARLWQERVSQMLLHHAEDSQMIQLKQCVFPS